MWVWILGRTIWVSFGCRENRGKVMGKMELKLPIFCLFTWFVLLAFSVDENKVFFFVLFCLKAFKMGYTRHRYLESFILDPGRKSGIWHAKPMPSPIQEMLAFNQVLHARWHGKCQMVCSLLLFNLFYFW